MMKDKIYRYAPLFFQNMLIAVFNFIAYKKRYGGSYKKFRKLFSDSDKLTLDELKGIQEEKAKSFMSFALDYSSYYRSQYKKTGDSFPILSKEELRMNIDDIYTISTSRGIVSKTGGTTGKSLHVLYTSEDMQERFALLDNFRSKFGYELGNKTAWFSGKNLLNYRDIKKNRFWKFDFLHRVKYYSTFHIKDEYLKYYVEDIIKFKPEYIVGFPSSILEIAKYGAKHGYDFPNDTIKAIFPTAETITVNMRRQIECFFKTNMYNQYASSEGAPFIFECVNHKLHLELQSGIFEVLDDNDLPTNRGRLVVTSFTTHGTPLVRYDIGDVIELSNESCTCGNNNPLVKEILGRSDDFVYSPENGKVNLGNVSNTLKGTQGIIKFQVIQDQLSSIAIYIVTDNRLFDEKTESVFLSNWRERIGYNMEIEIYKVDDIPNEKSGKYRIVKNNVRHLIS